MNVEVLTEMLDLAITYMIENEACSNCIYEGSNECCCNSDVCYCGIYNKLEMQAKRNIKKVS